MSVIDKALATFRREMAEFGTTWLCAGMKL
jgi:hypothetical protein